VAFKHPEHLRGFSYVGPHRYSLRFSTFKLQPLFLNQAHVDLIRFQIQRSATENRIAVVAYCFMPDHLHLLVEGEQPDSDCLQFIARAKQYSGFSFAREFKSRLWQRYGFERVLRPEESSQIVARYILENPVKAGLVARVEEYPFVGSFVHALPELLEWAYSDVKSAF
jgi:putative transposase